MPIPLAMLAYPAIATGVSAGGSALAELLSRRKKSRSMLGEQLRMLDENAFQNANQATANIGAQLGPALSARGMQNSSVGTSVLAGLASQNAQGALAEAQRAKLPLILGEQERRDSIDADRRASVSRMLSGLADTTATNLSGYGALREQDEQQRRFLEYLRMLGGGQSYSPQGGGSY